MFKDAARLTLDLLCEALDEKMTLRDTPPYAASGRGPGRSSSTHQRGRLQNASARCTMVKQSGRPMTSTTSKRTFAWGGLRSDR